MSDDVNDRFFDPEDYRASAALRGKPVREADKSLEDYVRQMREAHPIIWPEFQAGIDRYKAGKSRPYDNYWGRMNKGQELYRLGWDLAQRDHLLSQERAASIVNRQS